MADGMAKMIQLIATISDMQSRKRQLDLQEEQMRTQASQFTRRQGFEEGSEQARRVEKILDSIAKTSSAARTPLVELGRALGFSEQQTAALEHYGQNATQSLSSLQEQAAGRGAQQATPGSDLESYLGATSGMNRGQQATSGLQSQVASAAGQQFIASQQPGAPAALAKAGRAAIFGSMPGFIPFQQADTAREGVKADIYRTDASTIAEAKKIAAQMSSYKALGMLTEDQKVQGFGTMLQVLKEMRAKGGNDASRLTDLALYNRMAATIDPSLVIRNPDEAPDEASLTERVKQFIRSPGVPGQPPQVAPPQGMGIPLQRQQYNYQYNAPQNPMTPLFGQPIPGFGRP